MTKIDADKVLIYATSSKGLLVFDEPDFPHILPQVPGGTVELGEDIRIAAFREFFEETGLRAPDTLTLLGQTIYRFEQSGRVAAHRRHCFHVTLPDPLADTWTHSELTPSGGGGPIVFSFFWLSAAEAHERLGYGMEEALALLPMAEGA
jgi:8-oxo-dGTP pyrophosphatase MutT (NUDIX family)